MPKENNKDNIEIQNLSSDLLGDIDFQKFVLVFQKSIIWIVLIFIACTTIGYLYVRYTAPVYESSSILKLEIKNDVDALGIPGVQNRNASSNLSGELELIRSELIYDQVINILDELKISYFSKGNFKDEERFKNSFFTLDYNYIHPSILDQRLSLSIDDSKHFNLKYKIGDNTFEEKIKFDSPFKNEHLDIIINSKFDDISKLGQEEYYIVINSRESMINFFKENLTVQILNPSANTLKIIFRDPNPLKAKSVVDCINKVYLTNTLELKNQASKQTIDFLNEQLQKTEDKLVESESDLESFTEENKTSNISDVFVQNIEKIETLRLEIKEKNQKLVLLNNLKTAFKKDDSLHYHQLVGNYQLLSNYKSIMDNYSDKKHQMDVLKYSSKSNTLAYQYVEREINALSSTLENTIKEDQNLTKSQIQILRNEQASLVAELKTLPKKETEFNRLKRIYDLNEKFYLLLMDKKAEFGISEAGTIPDFQVLSPANLPSEAVFPKVGEIYLFSSGIALIISLILISLRFVFHNTIDSVEEIEKNLNIPMLGIVPHLKSKNKHSKLIVTQNPKSELAEAIRTIRTNLDFIVPSKDGKKVLSVTSTIGGEGKTFVSVNLAAIISMSNQKVILLDLDMRKPKLHLALEEENLFGMSNLIIGKMSIDEAIRSTSLENLDFISSGPPPPNPSELILLPELDNIIEELKKKYDVIIMDSPPIGLVTDGIILMKKADIPIYIIRSEFSKKGFLKSIKKLQSQKGVNHLSVIFNGLKRRSGAGSYGYGYGYGYGSDYYSEKTDKKILGIF